jgi:hypothetical protein
MTHIKTGNISTETRSIQAVGTFICHLEIDGAQLLNTKEKIQTKRAKPKQQEAPSSTQCPRWPCQSATHFQPMPGQEQQGTPKNTEGNANIQ